MQSILLYWNFDVSLSVVLTLLIYRGSWAATCPEHVTNRYRSNTAVFQDTCYLFVNNEKFWKSANSDCLSLGGEMLHVKDQGTMNFIRSQLNSKALSWDREGVWLGARYDSRYWKWTDGTKLKYSDWAPGEPSKYIGIYSPCVQMRSEDNWQWHNRPCGSFSFHYNYVCQFPAIVPPTTTTITTSTTTSTPSATLSKYEAMLRDSKDLKSDLYSRLGKNVYRLLMEEGVSQPTISLLLQAALANKNKEGKTDEGRISSSASNQKEDNGNTVILIIVICLTVGFLIITLIIFLIMRRHYRLLREKNEERAVQYHNGPSGNGTAVRRDPEDQPPAVPSSHPPPLNDVYLTPKEVTETYSQVIKPRIAQTTNVQSSSNCSCSQEETSSNSNPNSCQIGACGGNDAEFDMKLPLISGNSSGAASETSTRNGPTESCACHGSLGQDDYIEMRNMPSLDEKEKSESSEDKHTYCNTHLEQREPIANENLYETLP